MKILSVSLAAIPVCVCALDSSFVYVPRDVLPQFQTEQNGEVYVLHQQKQADKLCSVYFRYDARDKRVPSPVSLLRFVYDETEAKKHYPNAEDIVGEVARFIADSAEVDTERKLFFVSFADGVSPVQEIPEGIVVISVLGTKESNIDYLYKKEREHGNIFDRFLIAEECKREDKEKTPRIKNFPANRKEAALLLSFLAKKEFQLNPEGPLSVCGEEEYKRGLKLPYGVSLFVNKENSYNLELFDFTETRIKRLTVSSFDITKMKLKNTTIEELVLVDGAGLVFFSFSIEMFLISPSMERFDFYVEKVSLGNRLNPKSETLLKLIERVQEGETAAPGKIKKLELSRNGFFWFLQKTKKIAKRQIHVEEFAVTQDGEYNGRETSTKIVVSKKISIRGSARVLLFLEFGPELNHFNIDEIQRQCRSPWMDIPRINIRLTEDKIIVKGNLDVLQFFKKNIAATEMCFFAKPRGKALENTEITLVSGKMENIEFGGKGLSVLSIITNKKIDVRHMTVTDITCFFEQEKEEAKKKEFMIRERLYVRNTGILFLECLRNTVFIPVIEIEMDRCMEYWGGFGKTTGIHIKMNALVGSISTEIKQKIGEMITQKETVVDNKFGYPKLVFEDDSNHGEQNEAGESSEQPITNYQELDLEKLIKKYTGDEEHALRQPGELGEVFSLFD